MKSRLSELDWLEHGLKTLAEQGYSAIKAGHLARELKVTRGSFYWHFEDIESYRRKLLELWRTRSTIETIDEIDDQSQGKLRLNLILRRAFTADSIIEKAVRAWATSDTDVQNTVSSIDAERINYLQTILLSAGLDHSTAQLRAQFCYWSYLGQMMQPKAFLEVGTEEIDHLAALLMQPTNKT